MKPFTNLFSLFCIWVIFVVCVWVRFLRTKGIGAPLPLITFCLLRGRFWRECVWAQQVLPPLSIPHNLFKLCGKRKNNQSINCMHQRNWCALFCDHVLDCCVGCFWRQSALVKPMLPPLSISHIFFFYWAFWGRSANWQRVHASFWKWGR
jgi:hypothetical protein